MKYILFLVLLLAVFPTVQAEDFSITLPLRDRLILARHNIDTIVISPIDTTFPYTFSLSYAIDGGRHNLLFYMSSDEGTPLLAQRLERRAMTREHFGTLADNLRAQEYRQALRRAYMRGRDGGVTIE